MTQNSASNLRVVGGVIVLVWGFGAIPGVAADQVCYTTIDGFWQCTQSIPLGARIAIGVGGSILLIAMISVCFCVGMRHRRTREQEHQEAIAAVYQIEPSQIEGPPTTYITSFDSRSPAAYPLPPSAYIPKTSDTNPPTSFPETPAGYLHTPGADGLSSDPRTYGFPSRSPAAISAKSPHVHFPRTPDPQNRYQGRFSVKPGNKTPQTAPVNPAFSEHGAYPFPGYSPKPGPHQPYTAYSTRFPRQLYSGYPVQKEGDPDVKVRELV